MRRPKGTGDVAWPGDGRRRCPTDASCTAKIPARLLDRLVPASVTDRGVLGPYEQARTVLGR